MDSRKKSTAAIFDVLSDKMTGINFQSLEKNHSVRLNFLNRILGEIEALKKRLVIGSLDERNALIAERLDYEHFRGNTNTCAADIEVRSHDSLFLELMDSSIETLVDLKSTIIESQKQMQEEVGIIREFNELHTAKAVTDEALVKAEPTVAAPAAEEREFEAMGLRLG